MLNASSLRRAYAQAILSPNVVAKGHGHARSRASLSLCALTRDGADAAFV
jgi:hypothetical protein